MQKENTSFFGSAPDKSRGTLIASNGSTVPLLGFVKLVGEGHYLSLLATIKTVLAHSCRY